MSNIIVLGKSPKPTAKFSRPAPRASQVSFEPTSIQPTPKLEIPSAEPAKKEEPVHIPEPILEPAPEEPEIHPQDEKDLITFHLDNLQSSDFKRELQEEDQPELGSEEELSSENNQDIPLADSIRPRKRRRNPLPIE